MDSQGRKLWEFNDGNVWHVEFADLDGDGRKKIVHSNAAGEITVRDGKGKVISKSRPKPYFSDFSLIRWPDAGGSERLLLAKDEAVWVFDANAKVLAKFPAPDAGELGFGRGAFVVLKDKKRILATIVDFENWNRSILYLHDLSGKLLYQEILPESCRAIAVVPTEKLHEESLMIGCSGKVLEYHIQR